MLDSSLGFLPFLSLLLSNPPMFPFPPLVYIHPGVNTTAVLIQFFLLGLN